jgi:hypothetical protein
MNEANKVFYIEFSSFVDHAIGWQQVTVLDGVEDGEINAKNAEESLRHDASDGCSPKKYHKRSNHGEMRRKKETRDAI